MATATPTAIPTSGPLPTPDPNVAVGELPASYANANFIRELAVTNRAIWAATDGGIVEHDVATGMPAEHHPLAVQFQYLPWNAPFIDLQKRHDLAYRTPHNFQCWPDFSATLPRLREKYICASFTILSFRIIIDTARLNGLSWDAVISCEAIGKYKLLPEAYQTAARYLQLDVGECCMVACHNSDLDAARGVGFKTAFVRRPDEWGSAGPQDPQPNPTHDLVVDTFPELAERLGVTV